MSLEPSILKSTKEILGVEPTDTSFDTDIMIFINGAFSTLEQLGVGPGAGFQIVDDSANWTAFLTDIRQLNHVKNFVYVSTRMKFDPPTVGYLVTALEKQLDELTWRMSIRREGTEWVDPDPEENDDE